MNGARNYDVVSFEKTEGLKPRPMLVGFRHELFGFAQKAIFAWLIYLMCMVDLFVYFARNALRFTFLNLDLYECCA